MSDIIQTKSTRDQRLAPQHSYSYEMVVKIESYMCTESFKGDHKIFFIEYRKEGKIERISLSGKFRRARMA